MPGDQVQRLRSDAGVRRMARALSASELSRLKLPTRVQSGSLRKYLFGARTCGLQKSSLPG
jgi:hypothetical protein